MKKLVVLTAFLVAGCAVPSEIKTPSGKQGFAIQCTGPTACYKSAGEKCPAGYAIIEDNHDDRMVVECK